METTLDQETKYCPGYLGTSDVTLLQYVLNGKSGEVGFSRPAWVWLPSAHSRCPNCNSTDLKKVSLAYEEGLFCTLAHTRFRAAAVGGHGPDFLIGKATTRGFHQSVLSKRLNPPVKWSYRKLILWWVLVFLSIGWIVFYMNTGAKNSAAVLSPPLTLFALLSAATFLLLLVLFWRHNQTTYKRRYSQWERSFLCQRCGTVTEQE